MNLHREIEIQESKVVREEIGEIIKTSIFNKNNHFRECDKELLLQKWSTELSEKYSDEELTVMVNTLEEEKNINSKEITKWVGFIAFVVATSSFISSFKISKFIDEILLFLVIFVILDTLRIFIIEKKYKKSRNIYLPIIKSALKKSGK